MGRFSFVATLFVVALSCVCIAISDRSWVWAMGGVILFFISTRALRQFNTENETGLEAASNKFIIYAFLALFLGFAAIFIMFPP